MKYFTRVIAIVACLIGSRLLGQKLPNPTTIDASIAPYYDSEGPQIAVGRFSRGLASRDENEFLATISAMKADWARLTFPELYVASIQLYDRGYRNEAIRWFYTAQYRGRLFGLLLDELSTRSVRDPGFELLSAQNAFLETVGTYVNGFAFRDVDHLISIIHAVEDDERAVPDLPALYPGVSFKEKREWRPTNAAVAEGMEKLATLLKAKKDEIQRQRADRGATATFDKLSSKELPTSPKAVESEAPRR